MIWNVKAGRIKQKKKEEEKRGKKEGVKQRQCLLHVERSHFATWLSTSRLVITKSNQMSYAE
jgi:hypothetical protein